MQRFYISRQLETIEIFEKEKFHQLSRVLRAKIGDEVILFSDQQGQQHYEYIYEIVQFSKKSVELHQRLPVVRDNPENTLHITLFQSLPNKLEKLEWILEKNIEIGVQKFVFFRSDRSQKLFLSDSKRHRLQEIAREALEQCGGIIFPEIIFSDEKLDQILEDIPSQNIFLHTDGQEMRGGNMDFVNNEIGIWVGPEGGWSDSEISKMNNYPFITAHFGKRILRTESAGLCVAFLLNHK